MQETPHRSNESNDIDIGDETAAAGIRPGSRLPGMDVPTGVLPAIPQKRYFTIGEVSELCSVKPHVLRYWEQEFPQLKPAKRRSNRCYYEKQHVNLITQ